MSLTIEAITTKVRARRPVKSLAGERISLNKEQLSILRCMCEHGLQHKQISHELGITPRLISQTVAGLMRLAGCKTHAQLGVWAAKQGLV